MIVYKAKQVIYIVMIDSMKHLLYYCDGRVYEAPSTVNIDIFVLLNFRASSPL